MDEETLRRIGYVLDNLDHRLGEVEARQTEMLRELKLLRNADRIRARSLANLSVRTTNQTLALLDILGDMQAKLNPVYDRVMPAVGRFSDELRALFGRRRPN